MRHAVVVLCLMLSACAARKPAQVVPAPSQLTKFSDHVFHLAGKAGLKGDISIGVLSDRELGEAVAASEYVMEGLYLVVISNSWLSKSTEHNLLETAAHEVCHIALGHTELISADPIKWMPMMGGDSPWHRAVYRCIVGLIGEDLFCRAIVEELENDGNDETNVDTATCRAYLWRISQ